MYRSLIPIFAEEASSRRSQRWQSASERDSSPWRLQTKTGGWPTRHPPYSTTWVESLTSEVREETRSASERSLFVAAALRHNPRDRSRAIPRLRGGGSTSGQSRRSSRACFLLPEQSASRQNAALASESG